MLEVTLDKLPIAQEGIIKTVGGEGILRRRLLDMGLTPRTRVIVRKRAPLGDPLEIYIRRYELTLRAAEASKIMVMVEAEQL
ncbi:MAG: FeoA family protein [Phascolarctobacterium sp.]|nr:FeoA family protein [Phascolarctobacterium sp.]